MIYVQAKTICSRTSSCVASTQGSGDIMAYIRAPLVEHKDRIKTASRLHLNRIINRLEEREVFQVWIKALRRIMNKIYSARLLQNVLQAYATGTRGLSYHIPLPVPLWGCKRPSSAIPISGCRCGIGQEKMRGEGAWGKVVDLGMNIKWKHIVWNCRLPCKLC